MKELFELTEYGMGLTAEERDQLLLARFAGGLMEDPPCTAVPDAEAQAIWDWAARIRLQAGMLESVFNRHLVIAGMENGEPLFRLTPLGERYVEEELLPAAIRAAAGREAREP